MEIILIKKEKYKIILIKNFLKILLIKYINIIISLIFKYLFIYKLIF